MKIYLAGSVPKGDNEAKSFYDWRNDYRAILQQSMDAVELVDPSIFLPLEGDSLAVTGAGCLSIKDSDLVVLNAQEKLGAGTAMELVIAKYFKKPVVTILPKDTHHRKSNLEFHGKVVPDWIHPFIETFSDIIIEDISDISTALQQLQLQEIKNISVIDDAIGYATTILKPYNTLLRKPSRASCQK